MIQPEIPAGPLMLRPWRKLDASAVVGAWADPEILRWARYGATPPSVTSMEHWVAWNHDEWQRGIRAAFAVCTADGAEFVGSALLRDFGESPGHCAGAGEAGYWIAADWRGRGAATTALRAMTDWAFTPTSDGGLGLRRVHLRHAVANAGSCRVARKAGYLFEGTMRESYRYGDGRWHDEHVHGRLASDPG